MAISAFRSKFLTAAYVSTALICIGMGIAASTRTNFEWSTVYVPTGARLLAGENLYPVSHPFRYPPFSALIAAPFVLMPTWLTNLVFYLISFAAMILIVRFSWHLAGGRSLPKDDDKFRREIWIATLALLCAIRFSLNTLSHGQSDLLIGLLIVIGASALANGAPVWTGACWGLAAAFKGPPLLLVGYLLWRGRMIGALTMLTVFFAANLLPDLIHHAPPGKTWIAMWVDQDLGPLLSGQRMTGEWAAAPLDNQSISGALNRWLTKSARIEGNDVIYSIPPNAVPLRSANTIVYISYAVLAIVSALVLWPPFRPLPALRDRSSEHDRVDTIHPYAWEVSIAICLVLLVSPMSSRSHFCILLLPAMCLARAAVTRRDHVARLCLFTAIILSLASYNLSPIKVVHRITLYLGFVTFTTLSLLIGCWWMRKRIPYSR